MNIPKRKENRGGARKCGGRPIDPNSKRQQMIRAGQLHPEKHAKNSPSPMTLAQRGVDRMTEASERFAKNYKITVEELLLTIAHGQEFAEGVSLQTQLKALGMVRAAMTPPIQEGGTTDTKGSPPAILPVRMPDPTKVH